jgi:hypothetical protein
MRSHPTNRRSCAFRGGDCRATAVLLLVLALWLCPADGKPAAAEVIGLVSIADGEPFTIVRRDNLLSGAKGVMLLPEDIVATRAGAFVVIAAPGGNLIALGPSTEVYLLRQAELSTVRVLKGWVKADVSTGAVRIEGRRLAITAHKAVVLLRAAERSDAVFDEQGSASLLVRNDAAIHGPAEAAESRFFVREDGFDVSVQPRPSDEFVTTMPTPFRDPLPAQVALPQPVPPRLLRAVTYSDVEAWLSSPRDWRGGFTRRFQPRLKDPTFFAAVDAHLSLMPEWRDILHPKPPSAPPR